MNKRNLTGSEKSRESDMYNEGMMILYTQILDFVKGRCILKNGGESRCTKYWLLTTK